MSSRIADIPVPPRCDDMIRAGALVAINHSGGKDSQAMTILLSRIVPLVQLVAVHAPLGEVEWPGTFEHIEATPPVGVPLMFAPVTSGKSLLHRVPRGPELGPARNVMDGAGVAPGALASSDTGSVDILAGKRAEGCHRSPWLERRMPSVAGKPNCVAAATIDLSRL